MQICNRLYFNKARIRMLLFFCMAFPILGLSQQNAVPVKNRIKTQVADSLKTSKDSINLKAKQKSNQIDAEIVYSAQDSIVFLGKGTGFLHGKGDVKYKNIDLKADFIRVKMDSSLIFAQIGRASCRERVYTSV